MGRGLGLGRPPPQDPEAAELADRAIRQVQARPREAQRLATRALALARARRDWASAAMAKRASGLAARELWDLRSAAAHFRRAIGYADRAGDSKAAADARMGLSHALIYQGRSDEALRQAELAVAAFRGWDAAQARVQRAIVLYLLGRYDEAAAGYRQALSIFRRRGDLPWQARCLNNLGVLEAWRAEWSAAERDLLEAGRIYGELGMDLAVTDARWNLAWLAGQRGDIPAALAQFDECETYYVTHSIPRIHHLIDRCQVLVSARLLKEAREAATAAVEKLTADHRPADLAEARLLLAQTALLQGDLATARAAAGRARRAFVAQGRTAWATLARHSLLRAAWLGGSRSPATLRAAQDMAAALDAIGWVGPALDARLIAARVALARNQLDVAKRELLRVARGRRGTVEVRIGARYARALLHRSAGNRRGAERALEAGMRILDEHRAVLGATELRTRASSLGQDVAALGLQLAVEAGDPARTFHWAERWKAGTLRLRPVRPPDDAGLAADLAELRTTLGRLRAEALAGRATGPFVRRQAELEASIRRRTWRVRPTGPSAPAPAPAIRELGAALGARALVEILEVGDRMLAVVVADGDVRIRSLGSMGETAAELDALRFALRQLAREGGSTASRHAAAGAAAYAAKRIDRLVIEPVLGDVRGRSLVVVPTGVLHSLPWSLLPSLRDRPVTVAPSAAIWYRSVLRDAERTAGASRVVLVAGPDLEWAEDEVRTLRRAYGRARLFDPRAARVERVMSRLDGAGLAHLAAHGKFNSGNPLFSSLRLADGPLTVYDLERLSQAPRLFVLSACDAGRAEVRPGDELLGLAAALLALGTTSLVATVVPVNDRATRPLMIEFHRALREGLSPSVALAHARAGVDPADEAAVAAAAGFVCFGAG